MQKTALPKLSEIRKRFPKIKFKEDEVFHWSPKHKTVFYNSNQLDKPEGFHQLFHEIGHALCEHTSFTSGVQLLRLETDAWARGKELASEYGLNIKQAKIESCLDSYRDWLHARSTCPTCKKIAVEESSNKYRCFNCLQKWKVPLDQRTRNYRQRIDNRLITNSK